MFQANLTKNLVRLGLIALASAIVGLAFAGPASAQMPSGCVEYDDDCDQGPGGGGGNNPFGDGDGSGDRDGSGDADGKLPFTGYPLTGLILLLLILLAVGLAIRSGTALRDKFAHRQ